MKAEEEAVSFRNYGQGLCRMATEKRQGERRRRLCDRNEE
jgi:hypothetical protein